jgi:hypothetical protein
MGMAERPLGEGARPAVGIAESVSLMFVAATAILAAIYLTRAKGAHGSKRMARQSCLQVSLSM